jgi:imidazolonepropionase-like amidohydrolase
MKTFLDVHSRVLKVSPLDALYYATLAGAEILSLDNITGSLEKGKDADFLILNLKVRHRVTAENLIQEMCEVKKYTKMIKNVFYKANSST